MKLARMLVLTLGVVLAISGAVPLLKRILADTKPSVQLEVKNAQPREVEDVTQNAADPGGRSLEGLDGAGVVV